MLAASYSEKETTMFVQTLDELITAGKQKLFCDGALRSVRFLLKGDGMGFAVAPDWTRCSGTSITGRPTTSSPEKAC